MKTNWTFALAAIVLILGSAPVDAKPTQKTQSLQINGSDGSKLIATGAQQTHRTVVIVTQYKPNGTVAKSTRVDQHNKR